MRNGKNTHKIPADNYPIQTLANLSLNPSRPSSSEFVELHVFYVPEGSWNYNLNTISIEVVNEFTSAGFLRQCHDISEYLLTLLTRQALRECLGEFLGEDAIAEKFLFLKYIGNNLVMVKAKQESELKLKSFVPPYALQSELYLLPIMDHFGNIYSAPTISLDGRQTNGVAEAVEIIRRPVSVTLSKEEPGTDPRFLENTLKKPLNKNKEEAEGKDTPKENQTAKNQFRNSELPGSLEDSNNDCFSTRKSQFLWKNEDDGVNNIRRHDSQMGKKEYITLPDLRDFPSLPCQPDAFPGITEISLLQIHRGKVIKQMKQVKEERSYLQRIKEELIKVEKQYEQSTLKQYHACDTSKKKYFETKKVTASLEKVLVKFQEDLELHYKKLFMQLKAREVKMRPKSTANITNSKNNLILQITEVQRAIDQLKRKSDIQKIKLITEAKMRKQAISDVSTLKAELTQNKINTSLQLQLGLTALIEEPVRSALHGCLRHTADEEP